MAEYPLYGGSRYESVGADTAASRGTTVTASGTTHTKGSYTQLIAATAFDASWIQVTISPGTSHTGYLVDVGVGAAASEQVILPNLANRSRIGSAVVYEFPIHIPAGTRVAARCQSATASATSFVSAVVGCAPWGMHVPLGEVLDLGLDTATSNPTLQYDPGGTAHTKGSWSQLVASTAKPIRGIQATINTGNAAMSDADWLLDIGIGAAASEQVLVPNLAFAASAASDFYVPQSWACKPVDIPSGTRIAVRAQCSITDASDRLFFVAAYGVV